VHRYGTINISHKHQEGTNATVGFLDPRLMQLNLMSATQWPPDIC